MRRYPGSPLSWIEGKRILDAARCEFFCGPVIIVALRLSVVLKVLGFSVAKFNRPASPVGAHEEVSSIYLAVGAAFARRVKHSQGPL